MYTKHDPILRTFISLLFLIKNMSHAFRKLGQRNIGFFGYEKDPICKDVDFFAVSDKVHVYRLFANWDRGILDSRIWIKAICKQEI